LKDEGDLDVAVKGFYGNGGIASPADEALVDALVKRLDPDVLLRDIGARRFKQKNFKDALHAHLFQSEFNVSGISGGHVIENGHKVVIPTEAVASLDVRPVDGVTVEQAMSAIRDHFDSHGFNEVEIELNHGYVGGRISVSNWAVRQLIASYQDVGLDPEIWPRTSAAIAVALFTDELGMDWIGTCPGHAGRKHSANEFLQLSSFRTAIPFICRLMWRLGSATKTS
jgi:acetylornithine deacetylase/succinyl-diaminopimelate desuccinylase-like protein